MSHARRRFIAARSGRAHRPRRTRPGPVRRPCAPPPRGAPYHPKTATSRGFGGAVTSVDPKASRIGLEVLKKGGNAVDAAVATAAALGVTEPYSSGIGGGGYFVHYDARTGKVETIDGRETAPKAMPHDAFIDPETGKPYNLTPELVTSGVSVGTPGTLATWDTALRKWGSTSLGQALRPAAKLADRGFEVDKTFNLQTRENSGGSRTSRRPASCSSRRRGAGGRLDPAQPRPGGDVPADREARHPAPSTADRSPSRSRARRSTRRSAATRTCRSRPAT